ncbi:DNA polymerase III subunit epsilon [Paralimibaculum aggregatum]|uniref:DNA polymerase III subunit epsilon n=1 Tax=Paralimibaculum aggregatum TaxID=3036245 RepID=A0ABQ6LKD5_9RHOB|nr:DNA polymerase III subunit epsilon [Limibaculum sp. NKW23]GMG83442.1 DNA polymerase III subunit epsilon [Limibaculum sp. NKW23]
MREIVLDTETTGLDPDEGHRIVEIGAVELFNTLPTGETYHQYINPQRPMPPDAYQVHGLGDEFLRDKPVFAAISGAFLEFIGDAPLVIHNAEFDMRMINAELVRLGMGTLPADRAIDTLKIARRKFPGAAVSLDALCRRFGVDNSGRGKHGALLDSELLAEVYLELQGGRQQGLALDAGAKARTDTVRKVETGRARPRPEPLAPRLTEAERAAHAAFVEELGEAALWRKLAAGEG